MKKIPISELVAGIKFSKSVYLDKDTIFVSATQPITKQDLDRLKQFGISFVLTEGDVVTDRVEEKAKLMENAKFYEANLPLYKNDETSRKAKDLLERTNEARASFATIYQDAYNLLEKTFRILLEGKTPEIREFRELSEKLVDHVKINPSLPIILLSHPTSGNNLYNHICYATFFSVQIGTYMELGRPKLIDLGMASFFADLGMASITSEVLAKETPLTEVELKTIKKHPIVGYQVLTQKLKLKSSLAIVCLQHHENADGTGYPQRLLSNQIEELTKIYTIADHFSAMIFPRPHRPAFLPYDAMKTLISENVSKYDLKLVRLFLNKLSMFPVGSGVILSDGRSGLVIESNKDKPLRPIIRVTKEIDGKKSKVLEFVDLMKELNLFISKAIPLPSVYS